MEAFYNTIHICLPYLAVVYLSLFILIFLGWCFLNLFIKPFASHNPYLQLFVSLLTGILVFVFFSSVYFTGFKTVNLGFILIVFFLLYELKNNLIPIRAKNIIKNPLLFSKETIIFLISIPLLFFIWQVAPFISQFPLPFLPIDKDYIYGGRLTEFLSVTGEENRFFAGSLLLDVFKGTIPYHYFELWLNVALCSSFGINSTITLILVTRTLLLTNLVFGFLAMIQSQYNQYETTKSKLLIMKIISLLFVFFCGVPLNNIINSEYLKYSNEVLTNVMMQHFQKTVVIYVFITGFILSVMYQKPGIGIIILLSIPIIYFTAAPGIYLGIPIGLLILWLCRLTKLREMLRYFFYYVTVLLFVYFFYRFSENSLMHEITSRQLGTFKNYLNNSNYLADTRYLFFIIPITSCVGFLLWFFLILIGKLKTKREIVGDTSIKTICVLALSIYMGGLLAWLGFHFIGWDTAQFFTNLSPPVINLMFLVCLFFFLRKKVVIFYAIIIPFLLFSGWITYTKNKNDHYTDKSFLYSNEYILETEKKYRQFPDAPIVFILDSNAYYETSFKDTYNYVPLKHLAFFPRVEQLISIDVFNIPHQKSLYHNYEDERAVKTSVFYQFCRLQKMNGKFTSIKQSQLDFINMYKVKFLVLEKKSKSTKHLEHKFQNVVEDTVTGERFITLK